MESFGKSQPVRRVEDIRFLTGEGQFLEDVPPENAAFAYFFRSPVAHAEITELDVSDARELPGVLAVLTAGDLEAANVNISMSFTRFPNRDGSKGAAPLRPSLAKGRVRFVGEPVACIVADTMAAARDAAEAIVFDYEDLDVKVDLAPGGPLVHDDVADNVGIDFGFGDENAVEIALAGATHKLTYEVTDNRIICNSMEPRGCWTQWVDGRMHFTVGGQNAWSMRTHMAAAYGLDTEDVRVVIPDVGGGFGMKAFPYPEYFCLPEAARRTGRPVRWIGERTESMLTDNSGRDLVSLAELGFDESHRLVGYRVTNTFNIGAYNSVMSQGVMTELFTKVLPGVYDLPAAYLRSVGVYTNTTQVDAYRGAGRPEAIYVLERAMDYAARDLGVDALDLRRKNFIPVEKFPYRSSMGEIYDVGDFHAVLAKAEEFADVKRFSARKAASRAKGRLRGLGHCYYIESILGNPAEDVDITFDEDGGVTIYCGTVSNGQGHETVFTQYLSDQTGIPADKVRYVMGDSDRIARGGGTGGSRSVTVQTNVILSAVKTMISKYSGFLAEEMGVDVEDVSFDDERFRAEGSNLTPSFLEAARLAREAGRDDLLQFRAYEELPARSFPNGAHFAEVEIDPETGDTKVVKYSIADDFGNLINPMLAEGQVHGGVVQGIGQALQEYVVYDEDGQLLTATFMDYSIPRAEDVPMIGFNTHAVPSTANRLGMKGCGEAGTVGALAAVANAVLDATWELGIRRADMPFTPSRVWEMLQNAKGEFS